VRELDPNQPVTDVQTLLALRSEWLASPRLTTSLLGLFAFVALAITAAGLAGVIAFSVSQRTHEIGIRLAMGANRARVLGMVLRQGLALAALGLGIGLIGAVFLSRLIASLLYGVAATDPFTFLGVGVLLLGVALLASLAPARRAAIVDPVIALRST
jgi:putative ABC transport system permease protein